MNLIALRFYSLCSECARLTNLDTKKLTQNELREIGPWIITIHYAEYGGACTTAKKIDWWWKTAEGSGVRL